MRVVRPLKSKSGIAPHTEVPLSVSFPLLRNWISEAAKQELSPKPKCATTSTAHVSVAVSLLHLAEAAMGHEELSSGDSLPTVVADSGGEGASLARPLDAVWQHPVWGQYAAAPAAAPTN